MKAAGVRAFFNAWRTFYALDRAPIWLDRMPCGRIGGVAAAGPVRSRAARRRPVDLERQTWRGGDHNDDVAARRRPVRHQDRGRFQWLRPNGRGCRVRACGRPHDLLRGGSWRPMPANVPAYGAKPHRNHRGELFRIPRCARRLQWNLEPPDARGAPGYGSAARTKQLLTDRARPVATRPAASSRHWTPAAHRTRRA